MNGKESRNRKVDREIGERIRVQRLQLGLSQGSLGDKLGVTFQQIQKYESGVNSVAASRILALCKVLQIRPNDLFGVR